MPKMPSATVTAATTKGLRTENSVSFTRRYQGAVVISYSLYHRRLSATKIWVAQDVDHHVLSKYER